MGSEITRKSVAALTLTAVGVVYGDIGTSPLYAMRECFHGPHAVAATHENVLGVLSLIVYALILVVSIKYIVVVMRADNQGEGGILALTALVPQRSSDTRRFLILLGIFGAALLYGDGMITPAITVLSAVEGLNVVTPFFEPYVVPIAVVILVAVFSLQRYGTDRVGRLFGPVMVAWFVLIAILGVRWIVTEPAVVGAVDPRHAVNFFRDNGYHGFVILGAVFLVVTGGEALYADMGHFGRRPIRLAWFTLVLPALLINYFGQGAMLLNHPETASQAFFMMAPGWLLLPVVVIATAAAIIASQALISGAFSLTRQAIQLGYFPRLDVEHTSSHEVGQVYVPQMNLLLAIGTILIVVGFKTSTALAAAYGIAVTMTMVVTAMLLHVVAVERWRWPLAAGDADDWRVSDDRFRVPGRKRHQDRGRWLAAAADWRHLDGGDDDVEDRTQHRGRSPDRACHAVEDVSGGDCVASSGARARYGGVHDGAADRHASGARAQRALQQGAA